MTSDDIVKVVKLLKLSESGNDHESLSAIRRANAILKKHGVTWDKFFGKAVEPTPVPRPRPQQPDYASDFMDAVRYTHGFRNPFVNNSMFDELRRRQAEVDDLFRRQTQGVWPKDEEKEPQKAAEEPPKEDKKPSKKWFKGW